MMACKTGYAVKARLRYGSREWSLPWSAYAKQAIIEVGAVQHRLCHLEVFSQYWKNPVRMWCCSLTTTTHPLSRQPKSHQRISGNLEFIAACGYEFITEWLISTLSPRLYRKPSILFQKAQHSRLASFMLALYQGKMLSAWLVGWRVQKLLWKSQKSVDERLDYYSLQVNGMSLSKS